ncbi:MAG: hypothetical protein ACI87E_003346 [Mariniblastus sp.]|jgi:hypothetical protein
MSLANSDFSDDAFGDALVEPGADDQGMPMQPPPAPAPVYQKQGFSIYTVMLILSFVFLTTAAIMFFIDAGKY